jgi:AbrB family looped-hinge helix DNA binding protein
MQIPIDGAGRVVIPKPLRDALGFSPDRPLEAEIVDGRLELSPPRAAAKIVEGPHGPVAAVTGTPITDEEVRRVLEAARERG